MNKGAGNGAGIRERNCIANGAMLKFSLIFKEDVTCFIYHFYLYLFFNTTLWSRFCPSLLFGTLKHLLWSTVLRTCTSNLVFIAYTLIIIYALANFSGYLFLSPLLIQKCIAIRARTNHLGCKESLLPKGCTIGKVPNRTWREVFIASSV